MAVIRNFEEMINAIKISNKYNGIGIAYTLGAEDCLRVAPQPTDKKYAG
ncbi:MAG: hypothetical protein LBL04_11595 [Bacteroidales bacterium]|jgi:hypothetical protein|nr:hypothetical protein [Bacteroidales bacterium]